MTSEPYVSVKANLIEELLHALFAITGNTWTYDVLSDSVSVIFKDGTYYSHTIRYTQLDKGATDYAQHIVNKGPWGSGFSVLESATITLGKAIVAITPAMIERLIESGAIVVEGLTGNATVDRFWIRQDVSPSGDICMVVSGEGLPRTSVGAQLPFVMVEVKT